MEKPFSFPAACDIIMYYCILEVPHMEKTRREIMDRVYLGSMSIVGVEAKPKKPVVSERKLRHDFMYGRREFCF